MSRFCIIVILSACVLNLPAISATHCRRKKTEPSHVITSLAALAQGLLAALTTQDPNNSQAIAQFGSAMITGIAAIAQDSLREDDPPAPHTCPHCHAHHTKKAVLRYATRALRTQHIAQKNRGRLKRIA